MLNNLMTQNTIKAMNTTNQYPGTQRSILYLRTTAIYRNRIASKFQATYKKHSASSLYTQQKPQQTDFLEYMIPFLDIKS